MVEKMINAEGGIEYVLSAEERAEIRGRYPNTYFPDPSMEPLWHGQLLTISFY